MNTGKNPFCVAAYIYIPKHDFGSDLKEQKIHLQRLVKNLKG